jgi:predicted AAA+ superfamily ATPase
LNTALVTALANKSFQESRTNPEIWERLVEVSIGSHLINEGMKHNIEVYYWRKGNREIDFIIAKGSDLIPIEVKSGKRYTTLPGLELFRKKYKTKRSILIGMSGIGIRDFFETPILEWFK